MWDHELFLWLNFDGGVVMDGAMQFASGKVTWAPLYILILWLVWRDRGWRGVGLVVAAIALAVGFSDIFAGVFKHTGLLKGLLPDFAARLRPMHTPEIAEATHYLKAGGLYGTVSAHAATSLSVGVIAVWVVRRRWFSAVMAVQVAAVCYSRIYLGYHFPQDILLGLCVGALASALAIAAFEAVSRRLKSRVDYGE
ncbi:MAG: phosphatase PAP2 family protein [Rikenellaceae bacterium]